MLAVTVGLSRFWSSFELLSASKTSVMSNRALVELLLLSWPLGTPDRDLARCLSLATALGKERRILNPWLPAVCTESGPPLPEENDRWSPWPAPPSSPLAVLAFAPISHATNVHANTAAGDDENTHTPAAARSFGVFGFLRRAVVSYYRRTATARRRSVTGTSVVTFDIDRCTRNRRLQLLLGALRVTYTADRGRRESTWNRVRKTKRDGTESWWRTKTKKINDNDNNNNNNITSKYTTTTII